MLYIISLIIHVLSVVIWIGGVAFVTIIMFPMIQRAQSSLEQVLMFQGVEHRFSRIAKVMVILTGLSGLFLIKEKGLSSGVLIMIFVWTIYASLLFFLEKPLFKRLFAKPSGEQLKTGQIFFRLQIFHWFVLTLSFLAIAAGIWTAHY
jgi:putative copper export protein